MRHSLTLLSTLLLILHSCNPKPEKDNQQDVQIQLTEEGFYDFDIRNHLDQPDDLLLSSIANEIRYIPLETTPACFLSGCRQVEIFHNNIYVKDTKALYKFDMNGSFPRTSEARIWEHPELFREQAVFCFRYRAAKRR